MDDRPAWTINVHGRSTRMDEPHARTHWLPRPCLIRIPLTQRIPLEFLCLIGEVLPSRLQFVTLQQKNAWGVPFSALFYGFRLDSAGAE